MAAPYGKLLLAVYELEGLLLVLEKHGEETPASVFDLIKQKAAYIAEATQQVPLPEEEVEDEMLAAALEEGEDMGDKAPEEPAPVEETPEVEETPAEEVAVTEVVFDEADTSADDEVPQYKRCHRCGQLLAATDAFCTECGAKQDVAVEETPEEKVTDEAPAEEVEEETIVEEVSEVTEEELINDEESEEDEYEECESYDEDEDDTLSLEEKLHRGLAKNMRQAFSLNDSIRFRRELFGNSQAEYNDALDMVQSMKSFDEAEEYFYGDLGWDNTSEVVEEFMDVVKKHFLA